MCVCALLMMDVGNLPQILHTALYVYGHYL